jgi:dTDP-4-amino-4,6-dideoxygalactose transaminase
MVTTNDDKLAAEIRSIHNCGRIPTGVWYEHHVISGNYRLGELQGALLNAQLDRLEEQTKTRDANGRYLAERLASLPGVHPQERPAFCTRHAYHLFMLRLDAEQFGAPRDAVVAALRAEGIPCASGYGFSLHQQPMFQNRAFGPYLPTIKDGLDYSRVHCPNSDSLCREQAVWLEQSMFLGPREDVEDIARAFEKVYESRAVLAQWGRHEQGS